MCEGVKQLLMWKGKHSDTCYDASTPEALGKAVRSIGFHIMRADEISP